MSKAILTYHSHPAPKGRSYRSQLALARLMAHLALILVCCCAIVPFLWMVSTSLKTADAATAYPPQFIPHPIQWHNYLDVLETRTANFLLWTRNTLIITSPGIRNAV